MMLRRAPRLSRITTARDDEPSDSISQPAASPSLLRQHLCRRHRKAMVSRTSSRYVGQ